jgi:LPS export ABC transporter protein LptC/lipopolysaccharide transport protein LptA
MTADPPTKRRMKRALAIGAALALIAAGTAALLGVGARLRTGASGPAPAPAPADGDALVIEGLRQTAARDGVTQYVLNARSAILLQEEKRFLLTEPRVAFYRPENETFFLSAAKGAVATELRDMEAEGEVLMWNDRYRVRTERVRYTHAERVIASDLPVAVTGKGSRITADAGSVDLEANRVSLAGNVQAKMAAGPADEGDETLHIRSDRLLGDMDGRWVEFSGNARLDRQAAVITAEVLTAHYAPPGDGASPAGGPEELTLTQAAARGNVAVSAGNLNATAEEALYDPAAERLTLTGRPAAIRTPSVVVRGARLVVSLRSRHMSAEGDSARRVSVLWTPSADSP